MKKKSRKSLTEKQKFAWAERIITKWHKKLFLHEWQISIHHQSTDPEPTSGNGWVQAAEISASPTYLHATIYIYPNFWKKTEAYREQMLVHELCHCITEESYCLHIDSLNFKVVTAEHINTLRERMTQRIANIALGVPSK